MNKVLITGLGVGADIGVCESCNLDFSWLVRDPATLIWADKILITKSAWEGQIENKEHKHDRAINTVLQIAKDNNIIEIIDAKEMFRDQVSENIISTAEYDIENMVKSFPQNIKKADEGVPSGFLINEKEYCGPYIASMYTSMELAKSLDANCLFSERDYDFLKFKYGIDNKIVTKSDSMQALSEIFNVYFPNQLVLHNFAIVSDKSCNECTKCVDCKENYLHDIEANLYKIIEWRQYDEIFRAKEELEKIISIKSQFANEIDPKEVKREFQEKQKKINKNIRKVFPVIKRWTNLTTVIATPLSIYSAALGNKNTTIMASGALGLAKAADEYMKYYENKNKWVGFINKNII